MRKHRSDMKKGSSFLFVLLLALGLAITMSLYGWLLMLIIAFAPKMPPGLFPVLIVLYFGSLLVFGYFVYQRIELREERSILGDEVFFAMHPREWKREVRRWKDVDTYRAALVSALNPYTADQSDANWAAVKTAFVDGWANNYGKTSA